MYPRDQSQLSRGHPSSTGQRAVPVRGSSCGEKGKWDRGRAHPGESDVTGHGPNLSFAPTLREEQSFRWTAAHTPGNGVGNVDASSSLMVAKYENLESLGLG